MKKIHLHVENSICSINNPNPKKRGLLWEFANRSEKLINSGLICSGPGAGFPRWWIDLMNDRRLQWLTSILKVINISIPGRAAGRCCLFFRATRLRLYICSQRYRAAALDFLGTGRSDRLECWPVDWWRQAGRAAAALARHLGEERWISLGMSGGSTVALWQAIDFPDQVHAVVADSEGERYSPEDLRAVAAERNLDDPMSQQFWSLGHGPDWRQVVLADNDLLLRFAAAGGNHYGGRLKEVRCPVLFTGSLQDEFIRDLGEQTLSMLRQVQGSQAFLANSGGHPLMWTCPDLFYREVDGFLARLV
jgi:pimeloyl-ACP methyl ester carboxylesterase